MTSENTKLLVTGASGLLGNKIVTSARNDFSVVPLHNTRPLHKDSVRLDVTNQAEVISLFRTLKPYAVIHTASETNVDRCEKEKEHAWKTNVEGTRNIALACQEVNAKLAYISTDYVFDGEKGNYSEDEETNPINYYGLTKLESEKQVAQHCQDYIVLRTSVLYGWHPWKQNFVTWTIDQLRKGKEIAVVDDQLSSPTLADNLAEMSLEASLKNLTGVYHASGSERINRYDVARKIADIFDLDSNLIKPIRMSQLINWVARRPRDSSLNTGKIRSRLSAKPLNVTEGLQRMKEEEMR